MLAKIKEFFRKRIVQLKRKPQIIPLLLICLSCVVYTFELSNYSYAAIYSSDSWVAILVFLTTLFSILSIFTYLGAFDRKRVKPVMVILAVVQLVALFTFDYLCYGSITAKIAEGSDRIELAQAVVDLRGHMICLGLSIVFVVTRPIYKKLLQKINTTVKDNEFEEIYEKRTTA